MSDGSKTLSLSQTFEAPIASVYAYWTEPELLRTWWGTHGSRVVECSVQLHIGGRWAIAMQTPSGRVFQNGGVYLAIEPCRLLRFTDVPVADLPEWGGLVRYPSVHTVEFKKTSKGTSVNLRIEFETAEELALMQRLGMPAGISQGLHRLAQALADETAKGSGPRPVER